MQVGEKKDRVTDALNATKAAVEEGIVPGARPAVALKPEGRCWQLGPGRLRGFAFAQDSAALSGFQPPPQHEITALLKPRDDSPTLLNAPTPTPTHHHNL